MKLSVAYAGMLKLPHHPLHLTAAARRLTLPSEFPVHPQPMVRATQSSSEPRRSNHKERVRIMFDHLASFRTCSIKRKRP